MPCDAADPSAIFQCQMCGECCRGFGGTYVSPEDIQAISAFVGVDEDLFIDRYCRPSGRRLVIAQGDDGFCIFARQSRCTIHPVKPRMCRAWPFIEAVVTDPQNWQMMAGSCPGMRTDVDPETVRACVAAVLKKRG